MPKNYTEDELKNGRWVTMNGTHVFIKDGETPQEAIDRAIGNSSNKRPGSPLNFTKVSPDKYNPQYGEKWESNGFTIIKRHAKDGTVSFYVAKDGESVATLRRISRYDKKSEEDYFNEAVEKAQTLYDAQVRQSKALDDSGSKKNLQERLMEAEFGNTFGKPSFVKASERAAKLQELADNTAINPHFRDADAMKKGYKDNCALCTISTIMQMEGYNVEAEVQQKNIFSQCSNTFVPDLSNEDNFIMAGSKDYWVLSDRTLASNVRQSMKAAGVTDEDKIQNTINQVKSGARTMPRGAKASSALINDVVSKWDDGAFGEMLVTWKTGSSHSLFIFNDKGTVVVWDMQNSTKAVGIPGLQNILSEAKANNTEIIRYDNFVGFKGSIRDRLSKLIKKKGE